MATELFELGKKINFDGIPDFLKESPHWCPWMLVADSNDEDHMKKVPYRPDISGPLQWEDPKNHFSFEKIRELCEGRNFPGGVGVVLTGDSKISCADLDNSLEGEHHELKYGAARIVERFEDSNLDVSPSEEGLHLWLNAKIDGDNIGKVNFNGQEVEFFTKNHFVTVMGNTFLGYSRFEPCQEEATKFYNELKAEYRKQNQTIRESKAKPAAKPAGGRSAETVHKRGGEKIQNNGKKKFKQFKSPVPKDIREKAYAESALKDEVAAVERTGKGNRNNRLNEAAFKLGQYVKSGLLERTDVKRQLLRATKLPKYEALKTIESGLTAGMAQPRTLDLSDDEQEAIKRSAKSAEVAETNKTSDESNDQSADQGDEPATACKTVIDAIRALDAVCDHAKSKDGTGFNRFDRENHEALIKKALSEEILTPYEENAANRFLGKYKKQLKILGLDYDDLGHIPRERSTESDDPLRRQDWADGTFINQLGQTCEGKINENGISIRKSSVRVMSVSITFSNFTIGVLWIVVLC